MPFQYFQYTGILSNGVFKRLLNDLPQCYVPISSKGAKMIEQITLDPQVQTRAAVCSQLISVLSHTVLANGRSFVIMPPYGG